MGGANVSPGRYRPGSRIEDHLRHPKNPAGAAGRNQVKDLKMFPRTLNIEKVASHQEDPDGERRLHQAVQRSRNAVSAPPRKDTFDINLVALFQLNT